MEIIDEKEREKAKTEKKKGVAQAVLKVWELNDFVVEYQK